MKAKRTSHLLLLGLCASLGTSAADPLPGPADAGLGLGEAIRLTLENDPNIALTEARLEGARGALLGAAGPFDPVMTGSVAQEESKTPLTETRTSESRSLESSVGIFQQLRSGLSVTPSLGIVRIAPPGALCLDWFDPPRWTVTNVEPASTSRRASRHCRP